MRLTCFLAWHLLFLACTVPEPDTVRSERERITAPQISDGDFALQVAADTEFALAMLHEISAHQPNLVYAPHSISTALSMLYAGARGATASEMETALHLVLGQGVHPALNRLDLELQARRDAVGDEELFALNTVNDLWLQQDFAVEAPFLDVLAEHYGAGVRTLDFVTASDHARVIINDWVASQTEDRIRDLFPESAIDRSTRLVLTNAIYFKADWLHGFESSETGPGNFTNANGAQSAIPMMTQEAELNVADGDGYIAVELPYHGDELALLVVMPDADRRAELEMGLTAERLGAMAAALEPQLVALRIPRLELEQALDLNKILGSLGMPTTFTSAADFSGLSANAGLFVQKVVHKAFVLITEEGTEAAAATGASVVLRDEAPERREIAIDRPFIFFLRDRATGAVLLVGRVNELAASVEP